MYQAKDLNERGNMVCFPPETEKQPGEFEIKGQCGNWRRCTGFVKIAKTPQRKASIRRTSPKDDTSIC